MMTMTMTSEMMMTVSNYFYISKMLEPHVSQQS